MTRTAWALVLLVAAGPIAISLRPPTPTRHSEPYASPRPVCKEGYVGREARRNDFACVTPESHARVAWENRHWFVHTLQGGNTCAPGFVWREAFVGDLLCVSTEVRAAVREENRLAESRRVAAHPASCADAVARAYVALLSGGDEGLSRDGLDAEEATPPSCTTHEVSLPR